MRWEPVCAAVRRCDLKRECVRLCVFLQVFLKIEERDVENALKDRTLLGSILAAGLPS